LTGLTGIGVHLIEVQPDCETTEFRVHHYEDECVYILDGSGEAIIGAETFQISAGDFIGYRKNGLAHTIKNTGAEALRCLVVGERLPHDVGDYPHLKKRLYRNANLPPNIVEHEHIGEPTMGAKK